MASRRLLQTGASGYVYANSSRNITFPQLLTLRQWRTRFHMPSNIRQAGEHGTEDLGDSIRGITQQAEESRLFSDRDNDVYEYEKERNATERYERRDTDLKVIQLGEELGIKTIIVMAPDRNFVMAGVEFTSLTLEHILGWRSQRDFGQAGAKLGVLRSSEPRSITLEEIAARHFDGNASRAELTLAANSETTPDLEHSTGWEPQCSEKDWAQGLGNVFQYCYDESRKDP
ncbi:hypothetical protein SCAR479_01570 [Seiridium cardinale]|uniref:Uncharacterized protein n=1 Tax=Seiridium cardinale TaxID=138064 RepID=A0ABR2Y6L4_9PEZI